MQYNFEWDAHKAKANHKKHGISFRQAAFVFKDPMAMTLFDEEHSEIEERWITIGCIAEAQYVVVVHTFVEQSRDNVTIRLISARKATKHEIRQYEVN